MSITPRPVPSERSNNYRARGPRLSYDWAKIVVGQWQNWLQMPIEASREDAYRMSTKIRIAAYYHAKRHGMRVETRTAYGYHYLDLRFTPRDAA